MWMAVRSRFVSSSFLGHESPEVQELLPAKQLSRERESMPDSEGDKARSDTEESSSGSDSEQSGVPATD